MQLVVLTTESKLQFYFYLFGNGFSDLLYFGPRCFFDPVTNYISLYSTFVCENNARAPGDHKTYILTNQGGGRNRIDPVSCNLIQSHIEILGSK